MQRQTAVTDGEKWPTNSKMYLASVQTFGSLCLPKTARGLCPHSAKALVAPSPGKGVVAPDQFFGIILMLVLRQGTSFETPSDLVVAL